MPFGLEQLLRYWKGYLLLLRNPRYRLPLCIDPPPKEVPREPPTAGRLANAAGRLANAVGRLANAAGRLANAAGRLANTRGRPTNPGRFTNTGRRTKGLAGATIKEYESGQGL